jgi:23S rRNA (uracil-5-)-methyltransferase RumA
MKTLCPNKEVCGSCGWSHIPYEKQLAQKLSDINGSFKLKGLSERVKEIFPSPKTAHYRNRMDFVIDFQGRLGMREKGKWWRVIDGHTCFIGDEQIERLFQIVRTWVTDCGLSYYDRKSDEGILRYAVIRVTSTGETMITIVTSDPASEEIKVKEALETLAKQTNTSTVIWSINFTPTDVSYGSELRTISGPGYIQEKIDGKIFRVTPNAFFQTNSAGAGELLKTVLEFAGDVTGKTVLDLYCGSGFFSIPFASKAKRVIGVEMVPEAIHDAKTNAELNKVLVEFHDAKTEEFDWKQFQPDLLILDPPRSGMHDKALQDVLSVAPKTIVYVSCNFKNFARELVLLQKTYRVESMRAIDLFPHTPHVELVTKLVKK